VTVGVSWLPVKPDNSSLPGVDVDSLHPTSCLSARSTCGNFHEINTIPQIIDDARERFL
jgi:hypothetical protein